MDIPNLSSPPTVNNTSLPSLSIPIVITTLVLALFAGFWVSRFMPQTKTTSTNPAASPGNTAISTDKISNADQIKVGVLYGDTATVFTDSATGTVEKGSINGEGTHILNREGGPSQRASLTSSTVDLDLFVGKKVEVKGQTNASTKTAWLLDVGSIKVIE